MSKPTWDWRDKAQRTAFGALLAPLFVASRTRDFSDEERFTAQMRAWMPTLHDVPRDVIAAGVDRLLQQGVTWMPKPGDLKAACVAVVRERRAQAAIAARAEQAACETCDGTGFERVVDADGVERVKRCWCAKRAIAAVDAAGPALALPAAPPDAHADGGLE